MKKILYCKDRSRKEKVSLPFPVEHIFSLKKVSESYSGLIVFDHAFLKKRTKTNAAQFPNAVCFIRFPVLTG